MNSYVDSSVFVAVIANEPGAAAIGRKLNGVERIFASNLLEAEVRSRLAREDLELDEDHLHNVNWIHPPRVLTSEIARVLAAGYLRGADCWHIATALYFFEDPSTAFFLTLDSTQRAVAAQLGFKTDWSLL